MPNCIAVDLDQNMISLSLEYAVDGSVLIYPTKVNARMAKYLFQTRWQLEQVFFQTMEDFKQSLIRSPLPLLQDDKRLLCLYQAMSSENRSYYHIDSFEDMTQWGMHWFKLMQELREEDVDIRRWGDPENLPELYLQDWQIKSIPRIMAIREHYQELISAKGFSDLIFLTPEQSINPDHTIKRYVFVNQYYFTALEKRIISHLEAQGNDVVILHQGLEYWFDAETLSSSDFDLEQAIKDCRYALRSVNIIRTNTEEEQYLQFLCDQASVLRHRSLPESDPTDIQYVNAPDPGHSRQSRAIIDRGFPQKAQAGLFDPIRFSTLHSFPITQTRLFQTLTTISQILQQLTIAGAATYLPVKAVAGLTADAGLCSLWGITAQERDRIRYLLAKLSDENVLYLDLDATFFAIRDQAYPGTNSSGIDLTPLQDFMTKVSELISVITSSSSLSALIDVLDSDSLPLAVICSPDELAYTDIMDKVHERLANALSIEKMGIVEDWRVIFPGQSALLGSAPSDRGICLTAELMKLLLKIIKSAYISYHTPMTNLPDYNITDIQDSRNLSYDEAVFFNVIEGEYPTRPSPVWLFSENQRSRLGLISWEDVRKRERYYFFRLLLSSRRAFLYTYFDPEKSVEQSSFIGEIIELARHWNGGPSEPGGLGEIELSISYARSDLIRSLFYSRFIDLMKRRPDWINSPLNPNSVCFDQTQAAEWNRKVCTIPYDTRDFGTNHTVSLSYYALAAFIDDPFMWFVEHHCAVSSRQTDSPLQIGRRFFGTILHEYLRTIMQKVVDEYGGKLKDKWQWYNERYLMTTLIALISRPEYNFKLPLNYNRKFINEVILPALISAARKFLHDILPHLPIGLKDQVTIIPEKPHDPDDPFAHKQFISNSDETQGTTVNIVCNADLRIESPEEAVIIDFKTGSFQSKDQLTMYYWYYYVLEDDSPPKVTGMYVNPLTGEKAECEMTNNRRDQLYTKVIDALRDILASGYGTAHTRKLRDRNCQITRADLTTLQGGDDEMDD
ncbi:MAG: PD-(D/E)XK nuclease family protein [Candidatus Cloacimonetes bacterium]|nr:PD-(D/E)XK nuclease family protein [Candidatus Cloacimonadota bacterium]